MKELRAMILPVLVCASVCLAGQPPALGGGADAALLKVIWDGVQAAQQKYTTGRGTITETRTSKLLSRPLVFHGRFFAAGTTKFSVTYDAPEPVHVVFNTDYLNVTTGKRTEVIEIGHHVRRTQSYFSRGNSLANLEKNFTIAASESAKGYELKLVPKSSRFSRRVNYVVVRLSKPEFLLRSIEVDGTSGVHSRFDIQLTALNVPIPGEVFEVYRPGGVASAH
jgi:outer membrane lipoprotein-sorting protein